MKNLKNKQHILITERKGCCEKNTFLQSQKPLSKPWKSMWSSSKSDTANTATWTY